jgi:hypothetical protein
MERLNKLWFLLPLLLLVFAFLSCDTYENPIAKLEDAVDRIPDIQLIKGAENATINVKYDRDRSYFKITIDNTSSLNGEYNTWCVQMDINLQRAVMHRETRLYSTNRDKIFNRLSYIVNTRKRYEKELVGLSWREIQVAMWVIINTRDYNLAAIERRIPSSVEGYNPSYVNKILNDVKTNGSNFIPGSTDIQLIYYEVANNNQNGIIEDGAWAWANDVEDEPRAFPIHDDNKSWGWYILYYLGEFNNTVNGAEVFRSLLYAGAGQNVIEKGTHVGYVDLWVEGDILKVRYTTFNNYFCFTESQLNVSTSPITSSVPGSYPYKRVPATIPIYSYTHNVPLSDLENPVDGDTLYYAAHADIVNCP